MDGCGPKHSGWAATRTGAGVFCGTRICGASRGEAFLPRWIQEQSGRWAAHRAERCQGPGRISHGEWKMLPGSLSSIAISSRVWVLGLGSCSVLEKKWHSGSFPGAMTPYGSTARSCRRSRQPRWAATIYQRDDSHPTTVTTACLHQSPRPRNILT